MRKPTTKPNSSQTHKIPAYRMKVLVLALVAALPTASLPVLAADESDCSGNARVWGRVIGAGLGALIANKTGDGKIGATIAGAVFGGFLGDFIGKEIDRRNCELDKIARAHNVVIEHDQFELKADGGRAAAIDASEMPLDEAASTHGAIPEIAAAPLESGKVDVATWEGEQHFESGSARLTPRARDYFSLAAKQYSVEMVTEAAIRQLEREAALQKQVVTDADRKRVKEEIRKSIGNRPIVLVGHTDDTGDSQYNQILSEKRARAVAEVFKQSGIPDERLYYRGAGETDPIASNSTEEGRSKNRRVEVLELESKDRLMAFAALKRPKYEYYRPAQSDPLALPASIQQIAASEKSGGSVNAAVAGQAVVKGQADAADVSIASKSDKSSFNPNPGELPASSVTPFKATSGLDLGGVPAGNAVDDSIISALGKAGSPEKGLKETIGNFSGIFVKPAQASGETIYSVPCTRDRVRYAGDYKSLSSGKAIESRHKTADYAPGLYNTAWTTTIGNNYAGIAPVAVLRGNYEPASSPTLYLYANTTSPGKDTKATWKENTRVTVYPAEKGLLYRVFSKGNGDFVCADIVIPHRAPFRSPAGKLYYRQGSALYAATFTPAMLGGK